MLSLIGLVLAGTGSAAAVGKCVLRCRTDEEERQALADWLKLVKYFAQKRCNPIRYMTHALLETFPNQDVCTKVRACGAFGPWIIFPRDDGLVSHVTGAARSKYVRANPLNQEMFQGAGTLTRVTCMKGFLDSFLAKSIWFQPSGDVHFRQRELFLGFVSKFLTRPQQDGIYELAAKTLGERLAAKGPCPDMFDLLQEVVSVVQLGFISDYTLLDCSVEDYCRITNCAFSSMYRFRSPSPENRKELLALFKDMLERGGSESLIQHMKVHASSKLSKQQHEEELLHNLMAAMFLGQQALANAAYWVVLRLATHPALLDELRRELDAQVKPVDTLLPMIVTEEMRLHPPSSPFLMPYQAKEDDAWGSMVKIPKSSIVVVMPILLHLNEKIWKEAAEFKVHRHKTELAKRRSAFQPSTGSSSEVPHSVPGSAGAVPLADVHAAMLQKSRLASAEAAARCPMRGQAKVPTEGNLQHRFCPFGAGNTTCPMQGFSISVILALVTHVACNYDVTIVDEVGLVETPIEQHVVIDTGSRPVKRVRASFEARRG